MTREPLAISAAVVAAVGGIINLVVAFGVKLSDDQVGAINTAVTLVSALLIVLLVRPKVTPTADPQDDAGQPLTPEETP